MLSAGAVNSLILELRSPDTTEPRIDQIKSVIVEEHQGLIRHFIRFYDPQIYEDLVQVGTVGLLAAIDKFDVNRNVAFGTYAAIQIRSELSHFLRDNRTIRISRTMQENLKKVKDAQDKFVNEYSVQPSFSELESRVDLSRSDLFDALQANQSAYFTSLNDPETHVDIATSQDEFEFVEEWNSILPAIELLSPLNRRILGMRFIEQKKQGEIAQELGMNSMAVSRRLNAIVKEIRSEVDGA